jgi:hypothetical protein
VINKVKDNLIVNEFAVNIAYKDIAGHFMEEVLN